MKIGLSILFFAAISSLAAGQENPPPTPVPPPSIGLEVGQRAPAFALPDQFGHEQSNDTVKGSNQAGESTVDGTSASITTGD